jgi:hypothetical protein
MNKYKKKKKLIYKIYINNNLNSIINKCNKIKKFNIKTYKNKYYKINNMIKYNNKKIIHKIILNYYNKMKYNNNNYHKKKKINNNNNKNKLINNNLIFN